MQLSRYLIAATLARLADEGARVALILLAISQLGNAALGGVLVAALLIPHVVAAPVVGALADRSPHRARFQALAIAGFGGCLILLAVLAGAVPLPVLLLIAVAGGCLGPLVTGGLTSLLGEMVGEQTRDRAYGLDILTYNVAGIAGPAGAAFIAQWQSPALATIGLGGSALVAAAVVTTLALTRRPGRRSAPALSEVVSLAAFAVIWRSPGLRAATLASSLGAAGYAALPIGAVLLAEARGVPSLGGLWLAVMAGGGLLGSTLYASRPLGTADPVRTANVCLVLIALPLFVIPLVSANWAVPVLFGLAGVPTAPLSASVFLVRDRASPPAFQTQIFTLGGGIKMSCGALGSLLAGLAAAQGGQTLLWGSAALSLAAAVLGIVLSRQGEALPDTTVASGDPVQ